MSKKLLRLFLVLFVFGIATTIVSTSIEGANVADDVAKRQADLYKRWTETTPWGGTMQRWQIQPDYGWGEMGEGYQYVDPSSGTMVMYQSTSMGMGIIPSYEYGGMYSPLAQVSYGPFQYGNIPGMQSTPFAWSKGYEEGSIFGQTQAYQYQPMISPFGLMGGGLMGGVGLGSLGALGGTGNIYGFGPTATGYGPGIGFGGLSGLFSGYNTGGYTGYGPVGYPGQQYPQIMY